MKLIFVSLFLGLGCGSLLAEDKVYTLVQVFRKSKIDREALAKLNKRDASEESRMVEKDGKPPFNWVTKEEIFKAMTSPAAGENTVYLFSSAQMLSLEPKPPFLGPVLHVALCIEADAAGKVVGGVAYPLEYAMHFLSGEIREVEVDGGKLVAQATIDFKGGRGETIEYPIRGELDLTWLGKWNER
ncbi:hypothetical protein [Luteolibacter sp. Populi]|uniref:hypothetical protein n=1 Tax=Luteolibacter sp. Populi TaxID=3230487 RepID=UPI003465DAA6